MPEVFSRQRSRVKPDRVSRHVGVLSEPRIDSGRDVSLAAGLYKGRRDAATCEAPRTSGQEKPTSRRTLQSL
jgi:hypothetical protein